MKWSFFFFFIVFFFSCTLHIPFWIFYSMWKNLLYSLFSLYLLLKPNRRKRENAAGERNWHHKKKPWFENRIRQRTVPIETRFLPHLLQKNNNIILRTLTPKDNLKFLIAISFVFKISFVVISWMRYKSRRLFETFN